MTSFAWKRKAGGNIINRDAAKAFEAEAKEEEDELIKTGEVDWITLAPQRKIVCLEDARTKSERLQQEGSTLAEAERYWEAIGKWDEALHLTPSDEKLHEMKAQAYMSLCEVFPAIHSAQRAVDLNPLWWVAHQTLGRAQLGLGEVHLALKSFSRALHLNPADEKLSLLRTEDISWAQQLIKRKRAAEQLLQQQQQLEDEVCKIMELYEENKAEHIVDETLYTEVDTGEMIDGNNLNDCPESCENKTVEEKKTVKAVKSIPSNYVCMR